MKKIAIIGGGASGMMAAITAARRGARVTIYEHKDRVGKKILSTGNGKCNLTNLSVAEDDYRGNHPSFVMPVLEKFPVSMTLDFFEELGLFWKEKNGCVYPVSNQASTVLDLLRNELKRLRVEVRTDCGPVTLCLPGGKERAGFEVQCKNQRQLYDRVILATGSKAAPATGSDGSGYQIAKSMGHRLVPVLPALTALKGKEDFFKPVAGVRVDAVISLYIDGEFCAKETGELQLAAYGPSGIPVFQLSRHAIKALRDKKTVYLQCDFLPQRTEEELYRSLLQRREAGMTAEEGLTGIINKKLLFLMMKLSKIRPAEPLSSTSEKNLQLFCQNIKRCVMPVTGYQSFENAQVCQGGIDTDSLWPNLESRIRKGLFFAGEIIDIDGICGGYNLQWAWSSGYIAGAAAAEE